MNYKKSTIVTQIAWALLCVAWNAYGLWLVSNDQKPVAPTASLFAAFLCLVFGVLFWLFYQKRLKWPYIILSLLSALFAAYAVYGGFSQDRSLWATESWRWAGIVLNGMGALAGFAAVKEASKWP